MTPKMPSWMNETPSWALVKTGELGCLLSYLAPSSLQRLNS